MLTTKNNVINVNEMYNKRFKLIHLLAIIKWVDQHTRQYNAVWFHYKL